MPETVDQLLAQADAATGRGDVTAARNALERAVAVAPDNFPAWLRLASMRQATKDLPGAMQAIEQALVLDPLHFMALLIRARLTEQLGQPDLAGDLYGYALAQAPDDGQPLTPVVARMLEQARTRHDAFLGERDRVLADAIAAKTQSAPPEIAARLDRFRSNVLRRTRPYHSEPSDYAYPGLVEREFHDRADFDWLAGLEAAAADIRGELLALVANAAADRQPYVQYEAHVPMRQWAALNHSHDWTALHLLARGRRVAENADRCPATMAALATLPQPDIPGYGPNAMFSLLAPGAHIPPHTGVANTRLVCHLALVVPPGCWFRVGAERREWHEGEAFVFDDTIEHEAMNGSDAPRLVLIADVWHPGLDAVERAGVTALLAAGGRAGRVGQGNL